LLVLCRFELSRDATWRRGGGSASHATCHSLFFDAKGWRSNAGRCNWETLLALGTLRARLGFNLCGRMKLRHATRARVPRSVGRLFPGGLDGRGCPVGGENPGLRQREAKDGWEGPRRRWG